MSVIGSISMTPLARGLKLSILSSALLVADPVWALFVDRPLTINENTVLQDYQLTRNGQLTSNGATTDKITMVTGATLVLNGTTVSSDSIAIRMSGGDSTITGSNISSLIQGMSVGQGNAGDGAIARVYGSQISGVARGVVIGPKSTLYLENSNVSGTGPDGFGIDLFEGNLQAVGSTISGTRDGVTFLSIAGSGASASMDLNGSHVTGQTGSAIVLRDSATAQINVANGSTLTAGNGTLLEVTSGSAANMTVDNSMLTGNVVVEGGGTANLTLQNHASLTGRLDNVASLAVNSQAQWVMVGDGEVGQLALDGGTIKFGDPTAFYQLSVGSLSGNGTFVMDADFVTGQHDFLNVTGAASGTHTLLIGSSGADPVAESEMHVVHIDSGDAQFSLLNGPVDLGAFSYDLAQRGNDWYLDTATKVISPGTRSVLALFNTAPTVWYGELSTLRSRMGELRMNGGKAGGWIRTYGNKYNVSAASGVGYKQTQQGISFGADAPLPIGDGQWLIGLLGGYSKSDLDLQRGTSGDVDSYYVGAYTTWLDADSGYYVDAVLKFNRFQNESKVQLSDGTRTKGDYKNSGVGASVEAGRHIKLDDGYFVEPYTQLSGVVIQGKDYDLDNGLSAEGDRTRSLLGKVGATVGRNFDMGDGKTIQPYVRAAYAHEFAKNNEVQVNDNVFNNDLSGSRGELGAGVAIQLAERLQAHVDLDYSNGDNIEQPWGANFGVRYSW
ncbi:autotransporter outer membrane beta-barrel domain-containing protein [Pseudomonas sp. G.S.17]|uniref:autotransporter outer membrane beta-barrel domain-containing protein n=1 Tax=Pseudomonas sp. G.S.17 TaxID=3137451 RepID=UPI00311C904E